VAYFLSGAYNLFQANDNKILSQQFFFMVGGSGADEWVPL
jgi:hypothetical protein